MAFVSTGEHRRRSSTLPSPHISSETVVHRRSSTLPQLFTAAPLLHASTVVHRRSSTIPSPHISSEISSETVVHRRSSTGPSNPMKRMLNDSVDESTMGGTFAGVFNALVHLSNSARSQDKREESRRRVASELRALIDDAKHKLEKEREEFMKALLENSEQFESSLKSDFATFQVSQEKFYATFQESHKKFYHEMFSKFEVQKAQLLAHHEQQLEKDRIALAEFEKACAAKVTEVEEFVKEMQEDGRYLEMLFKNLYLAVKRPSNDDGNSDA